MLAIADPRIGAHLRETLGAVRRIVGCAGRQGRPALSRAAKSFIDSRTSTVGDSAGQL